MSGAICAIASLGSVTTQYVDDVLPPSHDSHSNINEQHGVISYNTIGTGLHFGINIDDSINLFQLSHGENLLTSG